MRLSEQFQFCLFILFFFEEKILVEKETQNKQKATNKTKLRKQKTTKATIFRAQKLKW